MKYKHMGGIALILTAAMALTACGASASSPAQTRLQIVSAVSADADTVAASAVPVDVDTTNVAAFADAFSDRDLSGTYDASGAVRITLNSASASSDSVAVTVSGSNVTITAAGTYLLSGTLENGTVIVDAGKEDKVRLVLDNVSINSDTFAAIYVRQADKVFVTLADGSVNTLSNGGAFEAIDDNSVDGVVFSKDDLTLNGTGKLVVNSPAKHGIVCKDDLVVTGGVYEITAASHALSGKDSVSVAGGTFTLTAGKDGVHSENDDDTAQGNIYIADGSMTIKANSDGVSASGVLQIDGGALDINAPEGLEGTYVKINNGTVNIYASDNGINAARKSNAYSPTVEINGGEIKVEVGPGDTDGIDSNGALIITGGTIDVTGNSAFDYDGSLTFSGGMVIVNGQQVDTIPNQMMGGRGGHGGMGGNFDGGRTFSQTPDGTTRTPGQMPDGSARKPRQTPDGSTQTPDGSDENAAVREWGGRSGKGRKTDGTLGNGRSGKGQKQAELPDAVTTPTQKTAVI